MSSSSLSEDVSLKSAALESGREGLEYSTEADMTMVSLAPESFLPSLLGSNSHHQLRDCFALSSISTCVSICIRRWHALPLGCTCLIFVGHVRAQFFA